MTRRSWILVLALASLAGVSGAARAATAPLAAQFAAANKAYAAGDYATAIDDYKALAGRGVQDGDLYFNLGNAYFESGDMGRAVLWYERARRLDPRDADIRDNLALTRSLLRDKQLVPHESTLRRIALFWHHDTTTEESAAIAFGLYGLLCILAMLFVFRHEPGVERVLRRLSIVSPGRLFGFDVTQDVALAMAVTFVVGGLFAGSAMTKIRAGHRRDRGVVVSQEVSVFSGPSHDATVQFKVHEGTMVALRDSRDGWIRVDLPGDLSGWVDAGALERI